MKKTKLLFITLIVASLFSCSGKTEEENVIYTSFYPIYDFTKKIVKDKFEVINITPYGSEPHDYEPKPKEIVKMTTAKALFFNGLGLESYLDSLPTSLEEKTYLVSKGISTMKIDGVIDPHIWLSIDNSITEMENILTYVKEIDPDNATYYEENYQYQKSEFLKLKQEYLSRFESLNNRYLVVSHAAFGYLCEEYQLEQVYVSGLSPDDEPTPKDMERIIQLVKEKNITTIFYEELVSDAISKKIADEAGVKTATLNPLEGLSEEDCIKGEDYLSIMRKNYDQILEALHD